MRASFPLVPLGDALVPSDRPVAPVPGQVYRQVGVHWWGEGLYEREPVDGARTRYQVLKRIEADDVVVNKIWARHGGVAVAPANLAGCYVSTEFPVFGPDRSRLEPRWLGWMTKTRWFWQLCEAKSYGSSGKNRIQPRRFLEIEVPLPPVPEQRRIAAKLDALAAKVGEARALRLKAADAAEAVPASALRTTFDDAAGSHGVARLGSLISLRSGEALGSSQMHESLPYPVYGGGGLAGHYSEFMLEEPTVAIGRVGARCGCVFVTSPRSWVTDNALYISGTSSLLEMKYLAYALQGLDLRQQAKQAAQPVVNQKAILALDIPVPPVAHQRRVVAYLDGLQAKVDELEQVQARTAAGLDALMPSVLDKAFRGEL